MAYSSTEMYRFGIWMTLAFDFQGHSNSSPMVWLDPPYMTYYKGLTVTYDLTRIVYNMKALKPRLAWIWPAKALKVKYNGAIGTSICDSYQIYGTYGAT